MRLVTLLKVQIESRGTYTLLDEYFGLDIGHWVSMHSPNDNLTHFDLMCILSHCLRFELRVEVQTPHPMNTLDPPPSIECQCTRWQWFDLFRLNVHLVMLLKVRSVSRDTNTYPDEYFGLVVGHWTSMRSPNDDLTHFELTRATSCCLRLELRVDAYKPHSMNTLDSSLSVKHQCSHPTTI